MSINANGPGTKRFRKHKLLYDASGGTKIMFGIFGIDAAFNSQHLVDKDPSPKNLFFSPHAIRTLPFDNIFPIN